MSLPFGVWCVNDAFNRAVEFEEEEDEQLIEEDLKPENEFVFRLTPSLKSSQNDSINVSTLILCTDNVSAGFADAYYLSQGSSKVGLICGPSGPSKEGNSIHQNLFWDKTCFVHNLGGNNDVLICQSKMTVEASFMFNWVKKIFSKINPAQVIILTSTPQCKLQLEKSETDGCDILRQLTSGHFNLKTDVLALEKPNLMRDLPAAVMTHCEVHGIPAILYVLATESHLFDVSAIKSFAPVLNEAVFKSIPQSSEDKIKTALKKLCNMRAPDKGVYI